MKNENDRKRKPSFSQKEVDVLTEKVRCQSDTLFSQFSDTLTNKKKKSAWFEVQNSVNATSMVYRNVDEIKKKWDDVKRNTKKRTVSVRRDRNLTGGGERSVEPLSSVEEAVVSLIGEEKIYGISEGLDCFQQQTAEVQTTKKGAAWVRKDKSLSGGAESNIAPLTTTEEIVVSLIGKEKIYGFQDEIYAFQQQF
ncbi:NAIF1 [Mytilus edulis]|uniref:NAIF1 n=1 Tax=Mytilus edulis TaxID=6550 RepID=A0A8S3RW94_MYTED|nr:NAIF1 [Mytilus edulis]